MKVGDDFWIEGVTRDVLRNGGVMNTRRFLVIHHTAGWTEAVGVMRERKVSCHFTIKRDGSLIQSVACNRVALHAGISKWRDPKSPSRTLYTGLNACSLGIELENIGPTKATVYPKTMGGLAGKDIPVLVAAHKHEPGREQRWELFSEAQLATCFTLAKTLVTRFGLDDLVGHEDISKGRKIDPGPAFPMDRLRSFCGFSQPLASL